MKNTLFSEVSPHSLSVVGLRMLVIAESDGKQNWGALRNERKCNDGHDSRLAVPLASYQLLPSVKEMLSPILNAKMVQNHFHILNGEGYV